MRRISKSDKGRFDGAIAHILDKENGHGEEYPSTLASMYCAGLTSSDDIARFKEYLAQNNRGDVLALLSAPTHP